MCSTMGEEGGQATSDICRSLPHSLSLCGWCQSCVQVVSELWKYIKAHNLQNPSDKRHIVLNSSMEEVFGVPELTMFTINKALTAHLTPAAAVAPSDTAEASSSSSSSSSSASMTLPVAEAGSVSGAAAVDASGADAPDAV